MGACCMEKEGIRRKVWALMDSTGVSRFPKPISGRIPNFEGAGKAAQNLIHQKEFVQAKVVKVNPDSPQSPVRREVLLSRKRLIMPTPRLRGGFLIINPKEIPKRALRTTATIRGAFKVGRRCSLDELPKVDLVVAGSVAVSREGVRIGKGEGYSEIEYGILRELKLVRDTTMIFTTVHDIQIIDNAPKEEHDVVVDAIITPTQVVRIERKYPQPRGILWHHLTKDQLQKMPILRALKSKPGIDCV